MLRTIWVTGLLALALTACGQPASEGTEPESENTAVEGSAVENSVADNASGGETAVNDDTNDGATNEDETGTAAGADSEAEVATAGPSPSPDPTLQAFYEGFTIPLKGDADAKVVIYEFSDYL